MDFIVYKENRDKAKADVQQGRLDYQDLSTWAFKDRFFAFLLAIRFLRFAGQVIPAPGVKRK